MSRTVWILGDQLTADHSALALADKKSDRVLFLESRARGSHRKYHKIKLAMIYSGMRHFARGLQEQGWTVDYHFLENTRDFSEGFTRHLETCSPREVLIMEPNSLPEKAAAEKLAAKLHFSTRFTSPVQFLRPREDFQSWARGKKRLLMETHYREMRQRLDILMDGSGGPEGGQWNLDVENRKTHKDWKSAGEPRPGKFPVWEHDDLTRSAIEDVERFFPEAPGSARDLWLPVTRSQALEVLEGFVRDKLGLFGEFEDMMASKDARLFHSQLSAPINIGLLSPRECVDAAVAAYKKGRAPLNSVEGFVRQIIGWREFINGVYWLKMPEYASLNALDARRPLPSFFYDANTEMNCLATTLRETLASGYNHHIQRLMILGNFLLLAGINPRDGLRWFTEMYVDAFDWVMAANVIGMSLHADGGFMATKPYAGSAAYIHKMSDYCQGCRFKPTVKSGPGACPYNLLYWAFYDRHAKRFQSNPRTSMMVNSWLKRPPLERETIVREAGEFLESLA